ncbi:MAG TPA: hypothetical protein VF821_18560 [Lentzea sp.]
MPREVETDPNAAVNHAWYSSIYGRNVTDYTYREIFEMGFRRGAQWSARLTGKLSPHMAAFTEFAMWVMDRPEDDIWDQPTIVEPTRELAPTNGTGDEDNPW